MTIKHNLKILVSTAEASGDLHASAIIKEIKKINPDIEFFGMGGDKMQEAGAKILFNSAGKGAVGVVEALPKAAPLYFAFKKMVRLLDEQKPDLVLMIDSQGFNMPLAKQAKKRGIKTAYYIPPQEWLWGSFKGIKDVADTIDLIIAIFEPEAKMYSSAGGNVFYHGHPLLDLVQPMLDKNTARKTFSIKENQKTLAIFPGNRKQEIQTVLPVMLKAAKILQKQIPELKIIVPLFSDYYLEEVCHKVKKYGLHAEVVIGKNYDVINVADLVMSSPGTVTLEASILGTPSMAIYKINPLTYMIGKYVVRIKLKYFSLINILNKKEIIPEFIQKNAKPELIADKAKKILTTYEGEYIKEKLAESCRLLGKKGAVCAIAKELLNIF